MTDVNGSPSARGLIESDLGPLRRFIGTLDSYPSETQTWGEGTPDERTSKRRSYNFKDIEVIEAVEPYPFPIYTIGLTESNRKKSRYGVFSDSLVEILDSVLTPSQLDPNSPEFVQTKDRMDWPDCLGKRLGIVLADGQDGRPPMHNLFDGRATDDKHPKGQDVPTAAWEVYMVEGVGTKGGSGKSPIDTTMELLDGKTLAEFNQLAYASDAVRGDVALLQAIGMPATAPNSFANKMVTEGKFTKDEAGVYHKVG